MWSSSQSQQKEDNNKTEDQYYPAAASRIQDSSSSVTHQTISDLPSFRSTTGAQLSPPPSYSVAMGMGGGESSFAPSASAPASDNSQPDQQQQQLPQKQIGMALEYPLVGHAPQPRGGVMVRVETEIQSSIEVVDTARRESDDDGDHHRDGKE